MPRNLSIVIPVYNARSFIERSFDQLTALLGSMPVDYEILFCDDASTDGSGQLLEALAARSPRVKVFFNRVNEGLGTTLRKLFTEARSEHIIYCDCDLPFGTSIIPAIVNELGHSDIVVASRYKGFKSRIPFLRFLTSRGYHILCRVLFRLQVVDIGSGTVGMRKDIFKKIKLCHRGFGIHTELFVKAGQEGFRVKEIPARANYPSMSSFGIFKHGPNIIRETIDLWCNLKNERRLISEGRISR